MEGNRNTMKIAQMKKLAKSLEEDQQLYNLSKETTSKLLDIENH